MSRFEIVAKDGMARICKFQTDHGTVKTPLLMPVIHPGKSFIKPKDMVAEYKFQMVITNSYIIKSNEQFRDKALKDGVHGLIDFDGPIMTDSGTFQMYFHGLAKEEIDPLEIVRFQRDIGTDIGTILDAFSDPKVGKEKVEQDVNLSLERARISPPEKGNMLLAGTIQGGIYPDLREFSAKAMAGLDFDVYPIGGVVPMMERYRYADIVRAVLAAKKYLPPNKPVHLFGCGHPMLFAQAALLGCDFFDSASYAKFAYAGRMMLTSGTVHLANLRELPCECPVCSMTTAQDLNSLEEKDRVLHLMKHNLYVSAAEIRRIRQAITDGKLMELTALRSRGHPALIDAFNTMLEYEVQLVAAESIGETSSIFYTGQETSQLPIFKKYEHQILENYPYTKTKLLVLVPDHANRPFSETLEPLVNAVRQLSPEEVLLFFVTPIGIIPWELEHVHPAQQCVFPSKLDSLTLSTIKERLSRMLDKVDSERIVWVERNNPENSVIDMIDNQDNIERIEKISSVIETLESINAQGANWTIRKLKALFEYQWGVVPKIISSENIHIKYSRKTGKIRHVQEDKTILFTLVPRTGLLTPTFEGGLALLKANVDQVHCVVMQDDAVPFVAAGKSALAKFVAHAENNLRAGEEVLVVDSDNNLLGVGKTVLSGIEMLAFNRGVAVVIRHSRD